MLRINKVAAVFVALTLGLTACGGGGGGGGGSVSGPTYTGNTDPVALDSTNAEPIGKSAADAAGKAVGAEPATGSSIFAIETESGVSVPTEETTNLTLLIARKALEEIEAAGSGQSSNSVVGATITADQLNQDMQTNEFCGGSITVPDNTNVQGETLDITMTFNNLCYDDGVNPQVTMNGTIRLIDNGTSSTVIFSNLTMTVEGGESYTLNASSTCDSMGECEVDFEGSDGTTYRMGNMSVSGDDSSGYLVSGTFYHPDYGSVEMSTDVSNRLYFNCPSAPQPSSGILNFVGDGGTQGSIEFVDCNSYNYCYDSGLGPVCNGGTW